MKITLSGTSYEASVGQQIFYKIADYAAGRRIYVVTDKNVERLYFPVLQEVLGYTPDYMVFPAGEKTKAWSYVEEIIKDLIDKKHNRNSLLVAFGGGVIGDVTGFVASVFMRGIDYLQVPTTLLAAVDSSTGGKTGINFSGLKNYVGTFKQPVGVVIDTSVFQTLPQREITSGAGEIVKTALLDADIFKYFQEHKSRILEFESPYIDELIEMSVFLKGGIVARDERDTGLRKTLNVGHTLGHALESADNFRRAHGDYVLSGIYYETNIADRIGIIDREYKKQVQDMVLSVAPELIPLKDKQKISTAMLRDKKNEGDGIVFILPTAPGKVQEVKLKEDAWANL